jgi:hypothetical protein
MVDVDAVLLRAADLVAERGWGQGVFKTHDGRLCMIGAVQVASDEMGVDQMQSWIRLEAYLDGRNPIAWNDVRGRTKTQVIRALLRAAGKEA